MSIHSGLIKKTDQVSDIANIINTLQDTTDLKERISILYNYGGNYCATKRNSIKNRLKYDAEVLTKKDFTYSLSVYDAKTRVVVDPANLNFEVVYSNVQHNYTTEKNAEYFSVVFDTVPKNQFTLTVKISGTNYLPAYAQITAEESTNLHVQNVGLVNINDVPEGVSVVSVFITQNDNGTTQESVLNFPQTSSHTEEASITIPQGAKFYDKNNQMLQGLLRVNAGHFSASNINSMSLFTSGWNVPNVSLNNQLVGQDGTYSFISCGFYSMEISDSSGKIANSIG